MGKVKEDVLQLLSVAPKKYSEIMFELGKPDKTIYVTLKELSEAGLITKDQDGKYILTREGQLALEQSQESRARSSLFGFLKKLFIKEPTLSSDEREKLESVLSSCWVLPTLNQMVERMIIENEKLPDISISRDSKLYELMLDYALAFLSLAEEVNELRRYAFLKFAEVYGAGEKKAEELAKKTEKMMYQNVKVFDLYTDVDRIPSLLEDIKDELKGLQEYKNLESVHKFINSEIEVIEMKYERFKESRTKFEQEVEAWTQKQSQPAKSQENPDPSPPIA